MRHTGTTDIATLDIEASGLAPDSYPIEVGIVLPDGQCWCSLIKPENDWHYWSEEAAAIHHIDRKDLHHVGKSVREIAQTLNEWLQDQVVYSDCWVLDDRWLRRLFTAAGVVPSFRLRDIMHILKEEQFEFWESTKRVIAGEMDITRHRATNDARILQQAFYRVNEYGDARKAGAGY